MLIPIQPSDSFPGCTQLTVTPDVPGYVQLTEAVQDGRAGT